MDDILKANIGIGTPRENWDLEKLIAKLQQPMPMEVERAKPAALTLDRRGLSIDVDVEAPDEEFMAANHLMLPLAGPAYQPYVSELLSFSIERPQGVHHYCEIWCYFKNEKFFSTKLQYNSTIATL